MLQSKAGYIDARPHIRPLDEVLLQCTAGPYIWVKSGNTQNEHILSALPPKADIDRRDAHLRFVPEADIRPSRSR